MFVECRNESAAAYPYCLYAENCIVELHYTKCKSNALNTVKIPYWDFTRDMKDFQFNILSIFNGFSFLFCLAYHYHFRTENWHKSKFHHFNSYHTKLLCISLILKHTNNFTNNFTTCGDNVYLLSKQSLRWKLKCEKNVVAFNTTMAVS